MELVRGPTTRLGHDVGLFKYPEEDFETDWITARSREYMLARKDNAQPWSCLPAT